MSEDLNKLMRDHELKNFSIEGKIAEDHLWGKSLEIRVCHNGSQTHTFKINNADEYLALLALLESVSQYDFEY